MKKRRIKILSFVAVLMFSAAAALGFAFPAKPVSANSNVAGDYDYSGIRFVQVEHGANHYIALSTEGRVYTWGNISSTNQNIGALGDGSQTETNLTSPKPISIQEQNEEQRIVKVGATRRGSFALTAKGKLYSWGGGNLARTVASQDSRLSPLVVETGNTVAGTDFVFDFATGDNHVVVSYFLAGVTKQFTIGGGGNNSNNQILNSSFSSTPFEKLTLNLGDLRTRLSITQTAEAGILRMYASDNSTYIATVNSRLFSYGDNTDGQLGNSAGTQSAVPFNLTDPSYSYVVDSSVPIELRSETLSSVVNSLGTNVANNRRATYSQTHESQSYNFETNFAQHVYTVGIGSKPFAYTTGGFYAWGDNNNLPSNLPNPTAQASNSVFLASSRGRLNTDGTPNANFVNAVLYGNGSVYAWDPTVGSPTAIDITSKFKLSAKIINISAGYNGTLAAIDELGRIFVLGNPLTPNAYATLLRPQGATAAYSPITLQTSGKSDVTMKPVNSADPAWFASALFGANGVVPSPRSSIRGSSAYATNQMGASIRFMIPHAHNYDGGLRSPVRLGSNVITDNLALYSTATSGDMVYNGAQYKAKDVAAVNWTEAMNFEFDPEFYIGDQRQAPELAGKYFEIEYSSTTNSDNRSRDEGTRITFRPLKATSQNWKVRVWIAVYDFSAGFYNRLYYHFEQIEFSLSTIANSAVVSAGRSETTTAGNPIILDSNSTTSGDYNSNQAAPKHSNVEYTTTDINTGLEQLYTAIGYTGSTYRHEGIRPLVSDPDGDHVRFARGDLDKFDSAGNLREVYYNNSIENINVKLFDHTVVLNVVDSPFLSSLDDTALDAWLASYPNNYGMLMEFNQGYTELIIRYESMRVSALKNSSAINTGFDFDIEEGAGGTYNKPVLEGQILQVMPKVRVNSSLSFLEHTSGAVTHDASQGVVIGNHQAIYQNYYSKIVGDLSPSSVTVFTVGETARVNLSGFFSDITGFVFLSIDNINTINNPQVVNVTRSEPYIDIQAFNQADFTMVVTIKNNNNVSLVGNDTVTFEINVIISTWLAFSMQNNVSIAPVTASTAIMPTQIFTTPQLDNFVFNGQDSSEFFNGSDTAPEDGAIKLISAGTARTDLVSVTVRDNRLVINPLADGTASITVTARYFTIPASATFNITVVNVTRYNGSIATNGFTSLSMESLVREIAFQYAAVGSDNLPTLTSNLRPMVDAPDFITYERLGGNPAVTDEDKEDLIVEVTFSSISNNPTDPNRSGLFYFTANYAPSFNDKTDIAYIRFYDISNPSNHYRISVTMTSRKFMGLASDRQTLHVFRLGKEEVTFAPNDLPFAFSLTTTALASNVTAKIADIGAIHDTGVSPDNRIDLILGEEGSITFIPQENGEQYVHFIVVNANEIGAGQPHYYLTYLVEVSGIKTVLTKEEYSMLFGIAAISTFALLFIIFLIRFSVYLKRRNEQKKIIKRNQLIIKMRDKMHQRPEGITKQQVVKTKLKMDDPKYAKLFDEMRQDKEAETGITLHNSKVAAKAAAKTKVSKKKGKKSIDEMRAELEAKKARLASMNDSGGIVVESDFVEPAMPLDDRAAIDEQIKAKLAEDSVIINLDSDV